MSYGLLFYQNTILSRSFSQDFLIVSQHVYLLVKNSVKQGASSSQMVDFPLVLFDFYGFRNFEVIHVV